MKTDNTLKKISLLFGAVVLLSGCGEEWLDPKPLSIYTPENSYNQASGLWGALVACERNMRHELTGDGPPILTEHIFSEVAVEGTTDKSGPAQDLNLMITPDAQDRKSTRLNSSHVRISYAVFCLKKK